MEKRTTLDQLQREKGMFEAGHDRFMQRQAKLKDLNIDKAHSTILQAAIGNVSKNLEARIEEAKERTAAGRPYDWVADLSVIEPELLAYLGLVCCMEGHSLHATQTKVLSHMGMRIEMEHFAKKLFEYDAKLAKKITAEATSKGINNVYKRRLLLSGLAKEGGFTPEEWPEERQMKAANPILSSVLEASGVFETYDVIGKKKKTVVYIGITEEASEQVAELNQNLSWTEPMFTPMVTAPRDWCAQDSGCYLDPSIALLTPLVRGASRKQTKMINGALRSGRMQPALDALNAIQRTAYCMNEYTHAAVLWAYENNLQAGSTFPLREKVPYHKYPENFDDLDASDKKMHAKEAFDIRTLNRQIDCNRSLMHSDMQQIQPLAAEERFYLPHSFDFRGRVYPVCNLNTHRASHIKSLFLFADKKRIGERGAYWIAVQVANTGDFNKISKQSFASRVEWVMDNAERLAKIGNDFEATFDDGHDICWSEADKPFEFLAACREFFKFWVNGIDYESGLAINLDGSASGIQHFAAASLTTRDAALVNLTPTQEPQDIYQVVADLTASKLVNDNSNPAEEWRSYGINRKVVKRNVMTYCYSSSQYGFTDQLMSDFMKPLKDAVTKKKLAKHPFTDPHLAARLLAKVNMESIREVVDGARDGMAFYQGLARAFGNRNQTVSYFTPVGFPVDNSYYRPSKKRLRLYMYDKDAPAGEMVRKSIVLNKKGRKVDTRSCASAIAPNIIHSLDAAHLCQTVLECLVNKGTQVRDFMLIHDSFGTHAANTDVMFAIVRKTFIAQYKDKCIYSDIKQQLIDYYKLTEEEAAALPDIPAKGDLSLDAIIDADYCFA